MKTKKKTIAKTRFEQYLEYVGYDDFVVKGNEIINTYSGKLENVKKEVERHVIQGYLRRFYPDLKVGDKWLSCFGRLITIHNFYLGTSWNSQQQRSVPDVCVTVEGGYTLAVSDFYNKSGWGKVYPKPLSLSVLITVLCR